MTKINQKDLPPSKRTPVPYKDAEIYHGTDAVTELEKDLNRKLTRRERQITLEEGYSRDVYLDSKGIPTYGVGQTKEFMDMSFPDVISEKLKVAKKVLPDFGKWNEAKKAALFSGVYRGMITPSVSKAIRDGNNHTAIDLLTEASKGPGENVGNIPSRYNNIINVLTEEEGEEEHRFNLDQEIEEINKANANPTYTVEGDNTQKHIEEIFGGDVNPSYTEDYKGYLDDALINNRGPITSHQGPKALSSDPDDYTPEQLVLMSRTNPRLFGHLMEAKIRKVGNPLNELKGRGANNKLSPTELNLLKVRGEMRQGNYSSINRLIQEFENVAPNNRTNTDVPMHSVAPFNPALTNPYDSAGKVTPEANEAAMLAMDNLLATHTKVANAGFNRGHTLQGEDSLPRVKQVKKNSEIASFQDTNPLAAAQQYLNAPVSQEPSQPPVPFNIGNVHIPARISNPHVAEEEEEESILPEMQDTPIKLSSSSDDKIQVPAPAPLSLGEQKRRQLLGNWNLKRQKIIEQSQDKQLTLSGYSNLHKDAIDKGFVDFAVLYPEMSLPQAYSIWKPAQDAKPVYTPRDLANQPRPLFDEDNVFNELLAIASTTSELATGLLASFFIQPSAIQKYDISQEDWESYTNILLKQKTGGTLSNQEEYFKATAFDDVHAIMSRYNIGQRILDTGSFLSQYVNRGHVQRVLNKSIEAYNKYEAGEINSGEMLVDFFDAWKENPRALMFTFAESIPWAISMATGVGKGAALLSLYSRKMDDMTKAHAEEYGKEPLGDDWKKIHSLAFGSALIDLSGDLLIAKSVPGFGRLMDKLFGKQAGRVTSDILGQGTSTFIERTVPKIGRIGVAAGGEAVAEGGAEYLEQFGYKRTPEEIDMALVAGAASLGAGTGGLISGIGQGVHISKDALGSAARVVKSELAEHLSPKEYEKLIASGEIEHLPSRGSTLFDAASDIKARTNHSVHASLKEQLTQLEEAAKSLNHQTKRTLREEGGIRRHELAKWVAASDAYQEFKNRVQTSIDGLATTLAEATNDTSEDVQTALDALTKIPNSLSTAQLTSILQNKNLNLTGEQKTLFGNALTIERAYETIDFGDEYPNLEKGIKATRDMFDAAVAAGDQKTATNLKKNIDKWIHDLNYYLKQEVAPSKAKRVLSKTLEFLKKLAKGMSNVIGKLVKHFGEKALDKYYAQDINKVVKTDLSKQEQEQTERLKKTVEEQIAVTEKVDEEQVKEWTDQLAELEKIKTLVTERMQKRLDDAETDEQKAEAEQANQADEAVLARVKQGIQTANEQLKTLQNPPSADVEQIIRQIARTERLSPLVESYLYSEYGLDVKLDTEEKIDARIQEEQNAREDLEERLAEAVETEEEKAEARRTAATVIHDRIRFLDELRQKLNRPQQEKTVNRQNKFDIPDESEQETNSEYDAIFANTATDPLAPLWAVMEKSNSMWIKHIANHVHSVLKRSNLNVVYLNDIAYLSTEEGKQWLTDNNLTFEEIAGVKSLYLSKTNTVILKGSNWKNNSANNVTVLHEYLHAATIIAGTLVAKGIITNPDMVNAFNAILSLQKYVLNLDTPTEKSILLGYHESRNWYEFITWGLTNPAFANYLASTPYGERTAWDVFKELMHRMLGFNTKYRRRHEVFTALDQLYNSVFQLARPLQDIEAELASQAKATPSPEATADDSNAFDSPSDIKVAITGQWFTIDLLRKHSKALFVFGDNDTGKGEDGQAQVRNEPNAIGLPTKKKPARTDDAYYDDDELEANKQKIDAAIERIKKKAKSFRGIVFPADGLGTGRSKLKEKAPETAAYLRQRLIEEFGFDNETGQLVTPTPEPESVNNPEEFTLYSGGAKGADTFWGELADSFGLKRIHHFWYGARTPNGNFELTQEEYEEGLAEANRVQKESWGRTDDLKKQFTKNLLARNWFQVKNSDAIFAVGQKFKRLKNGVITVAGGTGWAVQMAINHNKPVYVFMQQNQTWYTYRDGKWIAETPTKLTKNFGAIGTRQLNESGKAAIEELFARTFAPEPEVTQTQKPDTTPPPEEEIVTENAVEPAVFPNRYFTVNIGDLETDSALGKVLHEHGIKFMPWSAAINSQSFNKSINNLRKIKAAALTLILNPEEITEFNKRFKDTFNFNTAAVGISKSSTVILAGEFVNPENEKGLFTNEQGEMVSPRIETLAGPAAFEAAMAQTLGKVIYVYNSVATETRNIGWYAWNPETQEYVSSPPPKLAHKTYVSPSFNDKPIYTVALDYALKRQFIDKEGYNGLPLGFGSDVFTPVTDINVALDEAVKDGKSPKEMLQTIVDNPNSSIWQRNLAKWLQSFENHLGNYHIAHAYSPESIQKLKAQYPNVAKNGVFDHDPDTNALTIIDLKTQEHLLVFFNQHIKEHTFLHELIHAITLKSITEIQANKKNKIKYEVPEAFKELEALYQYVLDNNIFPETKEAEDNKEIFFEDLTEFVAYGLTEPDFMMKLNGVVMPKTHVTGWTAFKNAIAGLLGISTKSETATALSNLLDITGALALEQRKPLKTFIPVTPTPEGVPDISSLSQNKEVRAARDAVREYLKKLGFKFVDNPSIDVLSIEGVASKYLANTHNDDPIFLRSTAKVLSYAIYYELDLEKKSEGTRWYLEEQLYQWLVTGKKPIEKTFFNAAIEMFHKIVNAFKGKDYKKVDTALNSYIDNILGKQNISYKPKKGRTAEKIQAVLDRPQNAEAKNILIKLIQSKINFALSGSLGYMDQIEVYRDPNEPLHDLDLLVLPEDAEALEKYIDDNIGNITTLYEFKGIDGNVVKGIAVIPSQYQFGTVFSGIRHGKYIREYSVVDPVERKIVGKYTFSEDGETFEGITGVSVDFMHVKEYNQAESTIVGSDGKKHKLTTAHYSHGFYKKLQLMRTKDLLDWLLFDPTKPPQHQHTQQNATENAEPTPKPSKSTETVQGFENLPTLRVAHTKRIRIPTPLIPATGYQLKIGNRLIPYLVGQNEGNKTWYIYDENGERLEGFSSINRKGVMDDFVIEYLTHPEIVSKSTVDFTELTAAPATKQATTGFLFYTPLKILVQNTLLSMRKLNKEFPKYRSAQALSNTEVSDEAKRMLLRYKSRKFPQGKEFKGVLLGMLNQLATQLGTKEYPDLLAYLMMLEKRIEKNTNPHIKEAAEYFIANFKKTNTGKNYRFEKTISQTYKENEEGFSSAELRYALEGTLEELPIEATKAKSFVEMLLRTLKAHPNLTLYQLAKYIMWEQRKGNLVQKDALLILTKLANNRKSDFGKFKVSLKGMWIPIVDNTVKAEDDDELLIELPESLVTINTPLSFVYTPKVAALTSWERAEQDEKIAQAEPLTKQDIIDAINQAINNLIQETNYNDAFKDKVASILEDAQETFERSQEPIEMLDYLLQLEKDVIDGKLDTDEAITATDLIRKAGPISEAQFAQAVSITPSLPTIDSPVEQYDAYIQFAARKIRIPNTQFTGYRLKRKGAEIPYFVGFDVFADMWKVFDHYGKEAKGIGSQSKSYVIEQFNERYTFKPSHLEEEKARILEELKARNRAKYLGQQPTNTLTPFDKYLQKVEKRRRKYLKKALNSRKVSTPRTSEDFAPTAQDIKTIRKVLDRHFANFSDVQIAEEAKLAEEIVETLKQGFENQELDKAINIIEQTFGKQVAKELREEFKPQVQRRRTFAHAITKKEFDGPKIPPKPVQQEYNRWLRSFNWIRAFFEPATDISTSPSPNILQITPDVLNALANDISLVSRYLGREPTEEELNNIVNLINFHRRMSSVLEDVFVSDESDKKISIVYTDDDGTEHQILKREKDPVRDLRNEDGTWPENVKAAFSIALYSWVAYQATSTFFPSDTSLRAYANLPKNSTIPGYLYERYKNLGVREAEIANTIGSDILGILNIKPTKDAPANVRSNTVQSIGKLGLNMLVDTNYLFRNKVNPYLDKSHGHWSWYYRAYSEYRGDGIQTLSNMPRQAVPAKELHTGVEDSDTSIQDEKSILETLFSTAPKKTGIHLTPPIDKLKKTKKGGFQSIPRQVIRGLINHIKKPHHLYIDLLDLLDSLETQQISTISGLRPENLTHKTRLIKRQNLHDSYITKWEHLIFLRDKLNQTPNGLLAPFYLLHEVWKTGRFGVNSNTVNPQTDRFQRALVYMKGWETDIKFDDNEMMQRFFDALVEPLGFEGIEVLDELKDGEVSKAIKHIQFYLKHAGWESPEVQQQVVNTAYLFNTRFFKNGGLALRAMTELAKYFNAKESGATSFRTILPEEIDGKTNGPIIALMQYAGAETEQELLEALAKGGLFPAGTYTSLQEFLEAKDPKNPQQKINHDAYQAIARVWQSGIEIKQAEFSTRENAQLEAALRIMGISKYNAADKEWYLDDKALRNLAKNPLMVSVYGSGKASINRSIAHEFIEQIYNNIEDNHALPPEQREKANNELRVQLNTMLSGRNKIPKDAALMEYELSIYQINQINEIIANTIGETMHAAIASEYEVVNKRRQIYVNTAHVVFKMYFMTRQKLIDEYIADQKERLGFRTGVVTLPPSVMDEIEEKLKHVHPVLHDYWSQMNDDISQGIWLPKTQKRVADPKKNPIEGAYKVETLYNVRNAKGEVERHTSSSSGDIKEPISPGVGAATIPIHAADAAMMMFNYMSEMHGMGVHDAIFWGIKDTKEGGQHQNKGFWKVSKEMSISNEFLKMWNRVLQGVYTLYDDPNGFFEDVDQSLLTDLKEEKQKQGKEEGLSQRQIQNNIDYSIQEGWLSTVASVDESLRETVKEALPLHRFVLRNLKYVDQFGREHGGSVIDVKKTPPLDFDDETGVIVKAQKFVKSIVETADTTPIRPATFGPPPYNLEFAEPESMADKTEPTDGDTLRNANGDFKDYKYIAKALADETDRKFYEVAGTMWKYANDLSSKINQGSDFIEGMSSNFAKSLGDRDLFRTAKTPIAAALGRALRGDEDYRNVSEMAMRKIDDVRGKYTNTNWNVFNSFIDELFGRTYANAAVRDMSRVIKNLVDIPRQRAIAQVKNNINTNFLASVPTQEEKNELSKLVRYDIELLAYKGMPEIVELFKNNETLDEAINQKITELAGFTDSLFYIANAEVLGKFMVTGKSKAQITYTNAYQIAHKFGHPKFNWENKDEANNAVPIIDELATLYAIKYADSKSKATIANVIQREHFANSEHNGVINILNAHRTMKADAKKYQFAEYNQHLVWKGWTKDRYGNNDKLAFSNEPNDKYLLARGFRKVGKVPHDDWTLDWKFKKVNYNEHTYMYVAENGGKAPWLAQMVTLTNNVYKGTQADGYVREEYVDDKGIQRIKYANLSEKISKHKQQFYKQMEKGEIPLNKGTSMIPVFNPDGTFNNWRYIANEQTKTEELDRIDDIAVVMSDMAGNSITKRKSVEGNKKVVDMLYNHYWDKEKNTDKRSAYINIKTERPDIYKILPLSMKEYIKETFHDEDFMVRKDLVDAVFGYRKYSIGEIFEKHPEAMNFLEKGIYEIATGFFGTNAARYLKNAELFLMDIVQEIKDIIVVKLGIITLMNFISNYFMLIMNGMDPGKAARYQLEAYMNSKKYFKDKDLIAELALEMRHKNLSEGQIKNRRRAIKRIATRMKENPIHIAIEAGLMPTIVDSVNVADPSMRQPSEDQAVDWVLNEFKVTKGGMFEYVIKNALQTHDSDLYQYQSKVVQLSDFVARYAILKHWTEELAKEKKRPINAEERRYLIGEAEELFVNYDAPTSKALQYANDIGLAWFTKYAFRVNRSLARTAVSNPVKTLMTQSGVSLLDMGLLSTPFDSGLTGVVGNQYKDAWDMFLNPFDMDDVEFRFFGFMDIDGLTTYAPAIVPQLV